MRKNIVGNIPGFSRYYVSDKGSVYSNTSGTWKKMSKRKSSNGYLNVTLFDDNHRRLRTKLHILVAKVYIPNPNNKPCVCHKDNNRSNNSVENLYWGTYKENSQQMVRDGRHYVPKFKLSNSQVRGLLKDYVNGVPIKDLETKYGTKRVQLYYQLDLYHIPRRGKTNNKL